MSEKPREFWIVCDGREVCPDSPDFKPEPGDIHVVDFDSFNRMFDRIVKATDAHSKTLDKLNTKIDELQALRQRNEKLEVRIYKLREKHKEIRWSLENDAGRQSYNLAYEALASDDQAARDEGE